jgi:hypothetical protein
MYIRPTTGFRGFIWEPCSEQDVVVLFGRLIERGDFCLGLDYSWTAFPDCIATDTTTGETINIEFEFRSGSFFTHLDEWRQLKAADAKARWWLVSWKDDLTTSQRRTLTGIEVIALRDPVKARDQSHVDKTVLNYYEGPLDDARQMFEWRSGGLSNEQRQVLRQLETFGSEAPGFHLEWPTKPDLPWFTVRHEATGIECFKVHANGRIGFPFSRWRGISALKRTEILETLNDALATNWFTGRENKKKGCDAAWLLQGRIGTFLAAWKENLLR